MKIKNVYFLKSCTKVSQFPQYHYPEYAFIGRSNVGKSSLLNMILGSKSLVKTGSKPGVTKTINFFVVNDNMSFVDLPGFGYAKLPASVREQFLPMIKSYISNRKYLKLIFLLIDIRRKPGDEEIDLIKSITTQKIPVVITLTKCDKLSKNQLKTNIHTICSVLDVDESSVFPTSSKSNLGKKDLLYLIEEYEA